MKACCIVLICLTLNFNGVNPQLHDKGEVNEGKPHKDNVGPSCLNNNAMPASPTSPVGGLIVLGFAIGTVFTTLFFCCLKRVKRLISEPPSLNALDRVLSFFKRYRNVDSKCDAGSAMEKYLTEDISRSALTPNDCEESKRYCQIECPTYVLEKKRNGPPKEGSTATPRTVAPLLDKKNYRTTGKNSRYCHLAKFKTKLLTRFSRSKSRNKKSSTTPDHNGNFTRHQGLGFTIYHSTTSSIRSTKDKSSVTGVSITTPKVATSENSSASKMRKNFKSVPAIVIDFYDDDVFKSD